MSCNGSHTNWDIDIDSQFLLETLQSYAFRSQKYDIIVYFLNSSILSAHYSLAVLFSPVDFYH